jgi:hypothetical protein
VVRLVTILAAFLFATTRAWTKIYLTPVPTTIIIAIAA